jgi:hypothetical protein
MGVVSMSNRFGLDRTASGLSGFHLIGGNVICPARSSASIMPRHSMSHSVPLGCTQFQARHNFRDNSRRLDVGFPSIRARMIGKSDSRIIRPRYFSTTSMIRYANNSRNGT